MPGIKHTCLEDCTNLNKLYVGLSKEKQSLLKQAATENRFSELTRDDKQLVQKMNVEIEEFKQYLDILRNAIFLNKYIKMVQDTTTCKMRNVYFEARYRLAACRLAWARKEVDTSIKTRLLKEAEADIKIEAQLHPGLGSDASRERFEILLDTIQHESVTISRTK